MKDMLKSRQEKKRKKPTFIRQDAHKKAEVGTKWRKPKGLHSKMRLKIKGYSRCVEVGWGTQKEVKGLSREGLKIVNVISVRDLKLADPKTDGIIILKTGKKNKIAIIQEAQKLGLKILNIKDPSAFVEAVEEGLKQRKDKKKKVEANKEEKKKTLEKKAKEKEAEEKKEEEKEKGKDLDETVNDEIKKKEEEKKEQDKVLTTMKN